MSDIQVHPSQDVQTALVQLNDAICSWERSTGIRTILIMRDERRFASRSDCGKPVVHDYVTDAALLDTVDS